MILTQFQPVIDQINTLVGPIATLKAASDAGASAVSAQDLTDTVASLQGAVNALATAAGEPTQ